MSELDRVESLKMKHHELEEKLHAEEIRPHPDDVAIHDLKRRKLAIKDEIARMSAH